MIKRTERGWAGHFICADRCRFRSNTLVESGTIRIVVSTVGAMYVDGKIDSIGVDRYYETMAFHAEIDGAYWDANVMRNVSFESPWSLDEWNTPDIDNRANEMHEAVVAEIVEKLTAGIEL